MVKKVIRKGPVPQEQLQQSVDTTMAVMAVFAVRHSRLFGATTGSCKDGRLIIRDDSQDRIRSMEIGATNEVSAASVEYNRGTTTTDGRIIRDVFTLDRRGLLHFRTGGSVTELVKIDDSTGQARFGEGIGSVRQARAIGGLAVLRDAFDIEP